MDDIITKESTGTAAGLILGIITGIIITTVYYSIEGRHHADEIIFSFMVVIIVFIAAFPILCHWYLRIKSENKK
jgi:hypothetical protein